MDKIRKIALKEINKLYNPPRRAISSRYPKLKKLIINWRCLIRNSQDFLHFKQLAHQKLSSFYSCIVARHQSVLIRKLGDSDQRLQLQKIQNLKISAEKLNGLVINPGETFSFWRMTGRPSEKRGFINGMLLANGQVIEGVGGGLCQMSNLLFWLLLHAPVEVVERYHHSLDVFPDSGRVLPFGSGATILYNFVDLRLKNISDQPLQLKICLTDNHLKGQILSPKPLGLKFHLYQKDHCFIKNQNKYYRYNEIWRQTLSEGRVLKDNKILTNFAPVLYPVTSDYLTKNQFSLMKLSYQPKNRRAEELGDHDRLKKPHLKSAPLI